MIGHELEARVDVYRADRLGVVGGVEVAVITTDDPRDLRDRAIVISVGPGGLGQFGAAVVRRFPDANIGSGKLAQITQDSAVIAPLESESVAAGSRRYALLVNVRERTSTPGQERPATPESIRSAVSAALIAALDNPIDPIDSVAVPLLGAGVVGMHPQLSARAIVDALLADLPGTRFERVTLVARDSQAREVIEQTWRERTRVLAGGFDADHVLWDDEPVRDHLDRSTYADMIATVASDSGTQLPLAIGLFGAWGSGKSHFMRMIGQRISGLARQAEDDPDSPYCRRIVQIPFNAWHYADANLWASLATEVFERLSSYQQRHDPDASGPADARSALIAQLATYQEARRRLEEEQSAAETQKEVVVEELAAARAEREKASRQLRDVAAAARRAGDDPEVRQILTEAATRVRQLGEDAPATVDAVRDARDAALAATASTRKLIARARSRQRSLPLLAGGAVLLLLLGIAAIAVPAATRLLSLPALLGFLACAGTAARIIARVAGDAGKVVRVTSAVLVQIDEVSEERAAAALGPLHRRVEKAEHEVLRLEACRTDLDREIARLTTELDDLSDGRRLYRFIAERAAADDYRAQLGVVSAVRKDFESLAGFLRDAATDSRRRVDRIVLYIDDLDRCRASRVVEVLEAIHLLLAVDLFVVVVGVDPRWLRNALCTELGGTLGEATPQDYLEKIFQIPFTLPPMPPEGYAAMLRGMRGQEVRPTRLLAPPGGDTAGTPAEPAQGPRAEPGSLVYATRLGQPKISAVDLLDIEIDFLAKLAPLVPTPRSAKRMANVYRLLRTTRDLAGEANHWLGDEQRPGHFQAVAQLLAIVTAAPAVYERLLLGPAGLMGAGSGTGWARFLTATNGEPDDPAVQRLVTCLGGIVGTGVLDDLDVYREWAPQVARFSFELA